MIIELSLIQNFLLALGIVASVVVLGFVIHSIFKKHKQIKTEEPDLETGYKKLLKTANRHAKSILYETTVESANILTGARKTNEKMEENLDKVLQSIALKDIQSLKQTSGSFEKEYQQRLKNIQEQIDQTTKQALIDTQKIYSEKLSEFTNGLLKNGLATQETIDKKTAELLSVTESEIAEYKKSQFEKIETDAKKLLEKVYKDVLRTSIPQNIHQDLILKSLEQAQKDGIFKL